MDDIRLLRDLLEKCDPNLDYSKYDKRIKKHYLDLLNKEIQNFHFDKSKVLVKMEFKENEYDTINQYISSLKKLKIICNRLVNSNIDLTNLTIPKNYYKGDALLLNSVDKIENLIVLLSNFTKEGKMIKKINLNDDFAILYKGVKLDAKNITIKNKLKYKKMTKEDIAKDSLKYVKQYYINIDSFDKEFAHLDKVVSKNKIYYKRIGLFFKFILVDILPCFLVLLGSGYLLNKVAIEIPTSNEGWDIAPFIYMILAIIVFCIVIVLEAFLAKSVLNQIPILNSVFSFWPYLFSYGINLIYFLSICDANEYSLLFIISLVLSVIEGIFMAFLAGPNFRNESETNFSLLGRLIIGITYMDFILLLARSMDTIPMIIILVILTFATSIGIESKIIYKSPWYSKVSNKLDNKEKEN